MHHYWRLFARIYQKKTKELKAVTQVKDNTLLIVAKKMIKSIIMKLLLLQDKKIHKHAQHQ